jgi:hypothetical protein
MVRRDVVQSAMSLLTAAAGLLLPRRHAPGDSVSGSSKAPGLQHLLRELLTGNAPGELLSAEVGGGHATPLVRCRFARGADLDACASWVGGKVRAWLRQRTGPACRVEVSWGVFEPVVEARCREE